MAAMGARTSRLTRRRLVELGVAIAAGTMTRDAFAGLESAARLTQLSDSTTSTFATEPSWSAPVITVGTPASGTSSGFVFVAPTGHNAMFESQTASPGLYGPMIVDNSGQPVWFLPLATEVAQNFRAQTYRGRPVLTWYEGQTGSTYGGSCVIYDSSYREVKRVHGGNGYSCDLHEFLITERGTALLSIYNAVTTNLTSFGGSASGQVTEGIVQELDIERRKVLFEWHSLDHVALDESYRTTPDSSGNIDYFHLNSIGVDADDNLLVSARHTSTIYKLDRKTGNVIWRLGGMKSDFQMGPGATFNFQHDVRSHTRRDAHALRQRRDRHGQSRCGADVPSAPPPARPPRDDGESGADLRGADSAPRDRGRMRLYDTYSRSLVELPPPPGPIRMYFCGPTVYARAHIGNARPFVVGMWLRSWLRATGYDVTLVHNITDVNDKIYEAAPGAQRRARRAGDGLVPRGHGRPRSRRCPT